MASQARQTIMPEFGGAGSIGVIAMHVDWSRNLALEGISITIFTTGKHKADTNPFEAISDDPAARIGETFFMAKSFKNLSASCKAFISVSSKLARSKRPARTFVVNVRGAREDPNCIRRDLYAYRR